MPDAPGRFKAVSTDHHRFPIGVERDILAQVGCTLAPAACKS